MVVLVLEMCCPIRGLIFLRAYISVWRNCMERELLFLTGTGASLDWQF